jgi:hypothetical protein
LPILRYRSAASANIRAATCPVGNLHLTPADKELEADEPEVGVTVVTLVVVGALEFIVRVATASAGPPAAAVKPACWQ